MPRSPRSFPGPSPGAGPAASSARFVRAEVGVVRRRAVGRDVHAHLQPAARVVVHARHVLAALILVADVVADDAVRIAATARHAAARVVEVILAVAIVALLDLVADDPADQGTAQRLRRAVVAELVADHAAGHGADRGTLADARLVLGAHFLEVADARVPALVALDRGLIQRPRFDHARRVGTIVTRVVAVIAVVVLAEGDRCGRGEDRAHGDGEGLFHGDLHWGIPMGQGPRKRRSTPP